jgi:hypothetical protein
VRAGPGLEQEMLARAVTRRIGRHLIPFVETNDLLVLKVLAGRLGDCLLPSDNAAFQLVADLLLSFVTCNTRTRFSRVQLVLERDQNAARVDPARPIAVAGSSPGLPALLLDVPSPRALLRVRFELAGFLVRRVPLKQDRDDRLLGPFCFLAAPTRLISQRLDY